MAQGDFIGVEKVGVCFKTLGNCDFGGVRAEVGSRARPGAANNGISGILVPAYFLCGRAGLARLKNTNLRLRVRRQRRVRGFRLRCGKEFGMKGGRAAKTGK